MTVVLLPLWFSCFLFLSSCLIALSRISSTVYNINGDSGHTYLVPDLRGKAFGLSSLISCVLIIYDLNYVEVISFIPSLLRIFTMKACLILSGAFSASIEMIIWFLSLILLMWCITLIDWWMSNYPFIRGINPTGSWCMILLIYCWIQFDNVYWEFLHLCSSWILACNFRMAYFSNFVIRVMLAL